MPVPDASFPIELPGRRGTRLLRKTQAKLTPDADSIPLGSKIEATSRKRKVRQANLELNKAESAVKKIVSTTLARNIDRVYECYDANGNATVKNYDDMSTKVIHSAHPNQGSKLAQRRCLLQPGRCLQCLWTPQTSSKQLQIESRTLLSKLARTA